jgi:transcriptional regulator with XRE-family HTH domain
MKMEGNTRNHDPIEPNDLLSPLQRRVRDILIRCFAGEQTAMAKQIGCTQPYISQIVRGRRQPGPDVLRKISSLPGVSADWLLLGEGSPPSCSSVRNPARCLLPIYESLEPALENGDERVGVREVYPVSPADYTVSRFMFRIPLGHPCIAATAGRLRSRDLIMFDSNQDLWRKRPSSLPKKVCVIRAANCHVPPTFDLAYVSRVAREESGCGERLHVRRLVQREKRLCFFSRVK